MKVLEQIVTKTVTTQTRTRVLKDENGNLIAILTAQLTDQNPLGSSQMRIISRSRYEENKYVVKEQYSEFLSEVSKMADSFEGEITGVTGDDLGKILQDNPVVYA